MRVQQQRVHLHDRADGREYERVRSNPTWFVIKPDHDLARLERVVSRDDGYAVVEKLIAEEYMRESDPRLDGPEGSGS
jgi:hypothetical protein